MTPFRFPNPQAIDIAHLLVNAMDMEGGVGLSAPQIGVRARVCVVKGTPNLVMFNPKILDQTTEEIELEEGCLSIPGILLKISRPRLVKVRFTTPSGKIKIDKFDGLTARVIQHEIDHLNGKLFIDYAKGLKKDFIKKKMVKIRDRLDRPKTGIYMEPIPREPIKSAAVIPEFTPPKPTDAIITIKTG